MLLEEFILTDNIDFFLAKIAKLNKKAVKLNCEPIKVTVTKEIKIEEVNMGGKRKIIYHYTKVIIEGETPKLNGWELNSVKTFDPASGLMINSLPEKEMPKEFRETGTTCDHCKSNRIRNSTYILEKSIIDLTEEERLKFL
jgi:hypothetical protein